MDNDCASTDVESVLESLAAMIQSEERYYRCQKDYCRSTTNDCPPDATDDSASTQQDNNDGMVMKSSHSTNSLRDVQDIACLQQQSPSRETPLFRFWRQQMVEWAFAVVDSFQMDRELVAMAFQLLDCYVTNELQSQQKPNAITRDDFQLFSMTCLYLVVKLHHSCTSCQLTMEALVIMSKSFYSVQDIQSTELDILESLQWHVNPPTSVSFLRLFLQLLLPKESSQRRLQHMGLTLTEIALTGGALIDSRQAMIGLASVLYAARLDGVPESQLDDLLTQVDSVLDIRNNHEFEHVYRILQEAYDC